MNTKEFIKKLQEVDPEGTMTVAAHCFGGIAGAGNPVNDVKAGFDWDNGKIMLHCEHAMTYHSTYLLQKVKQKIIGLLGDMTNSYSIGITGESVVVYFHKRRSTKNLPKIINDVKIEYKFVGKIKAL